MMLQVNIVSAEAQLYSGQAAMVVATATNGEVGIRPKHAPMLAALKPGYVRLLSESGKEEDETLFYVSGGFLEVQPDVVTILADTALRAADLDEQAAREAETRAREELAGKQGDADYNQALIRLAEAVAQMNAIRLLKEGRK